MTTLIIDADTILYQSLMNAEQEVEFEEDVWMMTCDHKQARGSFEDRIAQLQDQAGASKIAMCFSDAANFRKEIYPDYKMNRKKQRKPMGFKEFRAEMIEEYDGIIKPRLEADDCVGILGTMLKDCIIYSDDKDLMQIPGKHLVDGEIVEVDKYDGDLFHMIQTLSGDPVDGYPGCPGIGPVKARQIMLAADTKTRMAEWSIEAWRWKYVVETYEKAGLTEDDALTMARVARILQIENWNKHTQEITLWTPTTK